MGVFVSSATKDLGDARERVCRRLLQLGIEPISMDWYAVDSRPPKDVAVNKVDDCDAFVIIVGHWYGSSPKRARRSFTEVEYNAAVASDKPVYAFLATSDF